jgi:hypothetical protein
VDDGVDDPLRLPSVLVATLIRDSGSWSGNRTFQSHLEMLKGFAYPPGLLSVAVLVADPAYYQQLERELPQAIRAFGFAQITLIQRNIELHVPHGERHAEHYQKHRRRGLARLRNFLLYTALRAEQGVLWLDADVVSVPPHMLRKAATSGKDIVAARCMLASGQVGGGGGGGRRGPRRGRAAAGACCWRCWGCWGCP